MLVLKLVGIAGRFNRLSKTLPPTDEERSAREYELSFWRAATGFWY